MEKKEKAQARKVMVVADPTRESAGALQYALSHVVLENDELILLHVGYPNSWRNTFSFLRRPNSSNSMGTPSEGGGGGGGGGGSGGGGGGGGGGGSGGGGVGEVDFLEEMKHVCETSQPKICVRLERAQIDIKDRATAILNRSKMLGVDLLIIGQRRSLSYALLGSYRRTGGAGIKALDTAEYLIENSKCTCVAVQKKGQNGGYLLNTKTHKNFWLLA